MRFEFATATRILFGPGAAGQIAPLATELGRRACVVTGHSTERAAPVLEALDRLRTGFVTLSVSGEPTTTLALAGTELARAAGCDLVISLGGGSVIDTGKVIAALLTNRGDLTDYLEVIGRGKKLIHPSAPHVAVPTTAGTGAEVTRNAVLGSPEHQVKVSLRSPLMLPRLALVDPLLTLSLPPEITASTGLDALTQLLEAFVSNQANPLTDGICREGLRRAAGSLLRAYRDGGDVAAREEMSLASLLGGLALANARLGAVHGLAAPLGGMFSAPHGAVCACLLPFVLEANVRALQATSPGSPILARFDELAQILTGRATAQTADGVTWVQELCRACQVPPLAHYGLRPHDLTAVVAKAQQSSSMKGNPVALTDEALLDILQQAL